MSTRVVPSIFKDAILLISGIKLLRSVGVSPGSAYGGTTIGFFAGNMAGVYGFDARDTLKAVQSATPE